MDNTTTQPLPLKRPPHVVVTATPSGMGHFTPLAEFAKRLIPEFTFTFIIPTSEPPSSAHTSFMSSLPAGIDSVFLPPVSLSDVPSDAKFDTLIGLTSVRSLPHIRRLVSGLIAAGTPVVSLVFDIFTADAVDIALEFGLRPYLFFTSNATYLSLLLHLDKLDETVACEFSELGEPVEIPGCIPFHGKDLLDSVQDRKDDAYKWVVHQANKYRLAEGMIVNSFYELEPGPINELLKPGSGRPPIYPVGPLTRTPLAGSSEDACGCLRWLDDQPRGSILFVNFGSMGSLTSEQQNELASGLEKSGQRFLWVARTPYDMYSLDNMAYYTVGGHSNSDPLTSLPHGFLERTKERGFVIPRWAPQSDILGHKSVGGFLSHCGWNSTLESIVHGVPFINWPIFHEQKMNAVMLVNELKVGLRPKAGLDGVVRSDEIATVVMELMEGSQGKKIGARMKVLRDAASVALSNHGSSTKAFEAIAQKWNSM